MKTYDFKVRKGPDNSIVITQKEGDKESRIIVPVDQIEPLIVMLAREVKSKPVKEA